MCFLENGLDQYKNHYKKIEGYPGDENHLIYSVFEQIQMGIAIVDAEGMCLRVNPWLCEILDYPESELLGPGFKRIIYTKEPALSTGSFNSIPGGNSRVHYEEKLCLRKDGEKIWIGTSISLASDCENSSPYFIFQVEDMTCRKEAELAFEASEKKFKLIFENANDGITINEPCGRFLDVNQTTCNKLGYSREELLQTKAIKLIPPEFSALFLENIKELYRCGYAVAQSAVVCKNGSILPVELSTRFIEYGGGPAILSIVRDISERKKAEQMMIEAKLRAEDANQAKSNFLASISHELRTPLNSIIGFADVLREKTFGPLNSRQTKYLSNISISGKHLLKLIDDILDLSKVEAGKMELYPEEFSVPEMFEEIKVTLAPLALKRNIKMIWETKGELKSIRADRTKFKQILYNLIDNAIKFSPENELIKIDTEISGDEISISITDSGPGISINDHKKLFEPFTQLDRFESREQPGTGLGLVIVKKYVEMHGGNVSVESKTGTGSKFSFMIPLTQK
jgi:PAS domain S-box-containing protein